LRTSAALGEEVWRRLTGLHYGIVGVGRSGSLLAEALVLGWGIRRLSLIDPDRLEPHNLGEMVGVREGDLGRYKADVLAEHCRAQGPAGLVVGTACGSITHLHALRMAQGCDVLFGCTDHDSARLALAVVAVLFCKPYLDVASDIHGTGAGRRMGVDVRLALPGERCLLCLGGLADPSAARRALTTADAERSLRAEREGRTERSGSLRSLTQFGVALALRLWEDFMAEHIQTSTWAHAEFDRAGRLQVEYSFPRVGEECRVCPLLSLGEQGLAAAASLCCRGPGDDG
jgi:hypothetical protein